MRATTPVGRFEPVKTCDAVARTLRDCCARQCAIPLDNTRCRSASQCAKKHIFKNVCKASAAISLSNSCSRTAQQCSKNHLRKNVCKASVGDPLWNSFCNISVHNTYAQILLLWTSRHLSVSIHGLRVIIRFPSTSEVMHVSRNAERSHVKKLSKVS